MGRPRSTPGRGRDFRDKQTLFRPEPKDPRLGGKLSLLGSVGHSTRTSSLTTDVGLGRETSDRTTCDRGVSGGSDREDSHVVWVTRWGWSSVVV